jgi:hypothetical protein
MNPISINGTPLPQQPYDVNENPVQIRTRNEAVDGSISDVTLGVKQQVVMAFDYASPALFQLIKGFGDGVTPVAYSNSASNVAGGTLNFTGLLTYEENSFVRGGSALVPLTVTIRQT